MSTLTVPTVPLPPALDLFGLLYCRGLERPHCLSRNLRQKPAVHATHQMLTRAHYFHVHLFNLSEHQPHYCCPPEGQAWLLSLPPASHLLISLNHKCDHVIFCLSSPHVQGNVQSASQVTTALCVIVPPMWYQATCITLDVPTAYC